jgi:hypothetical protein
VVVVLLVVVLVLVLLVLVLLVGVHAVQVLVRGLPRAVSLPRGLMVRVRASGWYTE